MKSPAGEYRCQNCGHLLEELSGQTYVAYRLTVPPKKTFGDH
jgi:phage FluMu protein Com